MRKLQTLLAGSLCLPSIATTQTNHPFEQQFQDEMSMLMGDNPITLFLNWLASPIIQGILLFLIVMGLLYCLTFFTLQILMIREVLPSNLSKFLKDWINEVEPAVQVKRKYPTPLELERYRIRNAKSMMEFSQPILATIHFQDKATKEMEELKQKLMGRKIEIAISNEGNRINIE